MAVVNRALRTDSERTRRKILDSARDMCREVGYEHVRMADVADRVGCTRSTVYNHFPSRDELLEALCVEFLDGYLDLLETLPEWVQAEDRSIFEVLRETVARELRWRAGHAELRGALDSAKRLRQPFYVDADRGIDDAMVAWYEAIYVACQRHGLLREDLDLAVASGPIYAMIDSVVANFAVNVGSEHVERTADQLARLQWHALFPADPDRTPPFGDLGVDLSVATRAGRKAKAAARPVKRRRRRSTPS